MKMFNCFISYLKNFVFRLLQTDPELFQTYKDLVVEGVISPEEFWISHSKVSAIACLIWGGEAFSGIYPTYICCRVVAVKIENLLIYTKINLFLNELFYGIVTFFENVLF